MTSTLMRLEIKIIPKANKINAERYVQHLVSVRKFKKNRILPYLRFNVGKYMLENYHESFVVRHVF